MSVHFVTVKVGVIRLASGIIETQGLLFSEDVNLQECSQVSNILQKRRTDAYLVRHDTRLM